MYTGPSYRLIGKIALSISDNYRYSTEKNKFINFNEFKKDGGTKEQWAKLKEEGYTFYQMSTEDTKISKELFNAAKNRVINTIKNRANEIEGKLSDLDRGQASRTALVRLALTHRGWLLRGLDARFMGYHKDKQTEIEVEGYYKSVYGLLTRYFKQKNSEYAFSLAKWDNLTDLEKRGVIRLGIDLAVLGTLLLLHHLLASIADDDDEYYIDYLAYLYTRVTMEQVALLSPTELYDTLKQPFPTLQRIGYIKDITLNLLDNDEIERGSYKGMTKREKGLIQLTPGLSVFWDYNDPDAKRKRLEQSYIIGY
jgi:hypothetical protein